MKQPMEVLVPGTQVRTHGVLDAATSALRVPPAYMEARRADAVGHILGVAPGHGGDVYLVQHEDEHTAAYCWDEFELDPVRPLPRVQLLDVAFEFEDDPEGWGLDEIMHHLYNLRGCLKAKANGYTFHEKKEEDHG